MRLETWVMFLVPNQIIKSSSASKSWALFQKRKWKSLRIDINWRPVRENQKSAEPKKESSMQLEAPGGSGIAP